MTDPIEVDKAVERKTALSQFPQILLVVVQLLSKPVTGGQSPGSTYLNGEVLDAFLLGKSNHTGMTHKIAAVRTAHVSTSRKR